MYHRITVRGSLCVYISTPNSKSIRKILSKKTVLTIRFCQCEIKKMAERNKDLCPDCIPADPSKGMSILPIDVFLLQSWVWILRWNLLWTQFKFAGTWLWINEFYCVDKWVMSHWWIICVICMNGLCHTQELRDAIPITPWNDSLKQSKVAGRLLDQIDLISIHGAYIRVTLLVHMCGMTHSNVTGLIHKYHVAHSYAWYDVFIIVAWLIYVCGMTPLYVWHDSFICVACLIPINVTHQLHTHINEPRSHPNASWYTHAWVILCIWISLGTNVNDSAKSHSAEAAHGALTSNETIRQDNVTGRLVYHLFQGPARYIREQEGERERKKTWSCTISLILRDRETERQRDRETKRQQERERKKVSERGKAREHARARARVRWSCVQVYICRHP